MILVYLNIVRMGEIPSGSSTKLNPRSTAVAPAVAFVRFQALALLVARLRRAVSLSRIAPHCPPPAGVSGVSLPLSRRRLGQHPRR